MQSFAGLSKVELFGRMWTAPLGTTAHSNVLGGVLAIYLVLSWLVIRQLEKKETSNMLRLCWLCAAIVSVTALFLTQSVSAWMTVIVGLLIALFPVRQYQKQIIAVVVVIFIASPLAIHLAANHWPSNESLVRRDYLNQAGWRMWLAHPWFGVGMQNSTAYVEEYSEVREVARFTQPPHHSGVLSLAETGLIGINLTFVMLKKKRIPLLLIPLLLVDHYLLSITSGRYSILIFLLL